MVAGAAGDDARARRSSAATRLSAPRSLNEPVRWRFSAFSSDARAAALAERARDEHRRLARALAHDRRSARLRRARAAERARRRRRRRVRRGHAARSSSFACRRAPRVALVGAEHPHELADDAVAVEPRDRRARRGSRAAVLGDREVARGDRGDLRQVRDREDLAALRRARAAARRPRARCGRRCRRRSRRTRASSRARGAVRRARAAPASRARARRPRRCRAAARPARPGWARSRTAPARRRRGPGSQRDQRDLEARVGHRQRREPLARRPPRAPAPPPRARR